MKGPNPEIYVIPKKDKIVFQMADDDEIFITLKVDGNMNMAELKDHLGNVYSEINKEYYRIEQERKQEAKKESQKEDEDEKKEDE